VKTSDRPTCLRCAHYFITFDPAFPYGCRAMNFKSRTLPETEVRTASGLDCQMFQPKHAIRKKWEANDKSR
jgi:hypothetical protein